MTSTAVRQAAWGMLLIASGSFFVTIVPGDGMTGMVVFPLWFSGGYLGIVALTKIRSLDTDRKLIVWALAALALASVVISFDATWVYSRDWDKRHKQDERRR